MLMTAPFSELWCCSRTSQSGFFIYRYGPTTRRRLMATRRRLTEIGMRKSRVALAAALLTAPGATLSAQGTTFNACYVHNAGAIYLIRIAGLPQNCLSTAHVEITWTDGSSNVPDGSIVPVKLADGSV